MTKEDIKKALEICADDCYSCDDCPYDDVINCGNTLKNDVYELIIKQEREIEDLKDEIIYLERKIAIRDNALKDRDKAIEMLEGKQDTIVKQAKIDVLNKAKEKLDSAPNGWAYTTYIDELIEEVENDK